MKGIAFKVKRVISLVLSVALISGMILNLPITSSAVSTPVSEDERKNETVAEKEIPVYFQMASEDLFKIIVSGPGQKASASFNAASVSTNLSPRHL